MSVGQRINLVTISTSLCDKGLAVFVLSTAEDKTTKQEKSEVITLER